MKVNIYVGKTECTMNGYKNNARPKPENYNENCISCKKCSFSSMCKIINKSLL